MNMKHDHPGHCPGCGAEMILRSSQYGYFWGCFNWPGCQYLIGCHPGTTTPLGVPADLATRQLRRQAHDIFDLLWMGPNSMMGRKEAYAWLAGRMGLAVEATHFGHFGAEQCREAIGHVRQLRGGGGLATIGQALVARRLEAARGC